MAEFDRPTQSEFVADATRRERDRQWVVRLRTGDERALAEMFAAYYVPLSRYAETIVHSRDVAFDVASDVFEAVWLKRDELDLLDLRAYLLTATRNRALNAERHRRVEEAAVLTAAQWMPVPAPTDSPGADEALAAEEEAQDRSAAIARAYAALPPGTRAVLIRWAQGQSYQEIGRVLGIAVKTVDAHLQKAKRIFRHIFGSQG